MTNENNVTKIMEDVKHKLMWNWIIDILKYVRENDIEKNFKYTITYNNKDIKLNIRIFDDINDIKFNITKKVFKENKNIINNCYLCEYIRKGDVFYVDCGNCPAKEIIIDEQYRKYIEHPDTCLNGVYVVSCIDSFYHLTIISQEEFDSVIYCCEKIRDVEYKDNVVLRSKLNNGLNKLKDSNTKEIGWDNDLSLFIAGRIVLSTETNELGFISQVTCFDRFPSFRVSWISDLNNENDIFINWLFEDTYFNSIKYFDATLTYSELEDIIYHSNDSEQFRFELTELLNEKIVDKKPIEIVIKN